MASVGVRNIRGGHSDVHRAQSVGVDLDAVPGQSRALNHDIIDAGSAYVPQQGFDVLGRAEVFGLPRLQARVAHEDPLGPRLPQGAGYPRNQ